MIAWAQARQFREMTSFLDSAQARNKALGACDAQAYDSAVAEVGLMLTASARTAACRVGDAWSLCTRLPGTLAALESGRITLAKARILDAETANLSGEHLAAVEARVLAKAPKQTPGQLRAATRRAVISADPAAAQKRAERARRERGVQLWPEPDGMATLSAYLPAGDALGVFAVLDEHARHAGFPGDERTLEARRGDALIDLVLNPTGYCSQATSTARDHTTPAPDGEHHNTPGTSSGSTSRSTPEGYVPTPDTTNPASCRCACGHCRRGGGVDVRVTIPYTALLGANDHPGELAGYGPVPAVVARDLAAGGHLAAHPHRPSLRPAPGLRHHPLPAPSPPRRAGDHPGSNLPVPRLPSHRPPLRHRPQHPLRSGHRHRPDQRIQPRDQAPPPPRETDPRLVSHPPPRQLHHLDHPQRTPLPLPATTTDRPRTTHPTPHTRPGRAPALLTPCPVVG